jgi:2-iminobutanoate/2-iminopropanoate deaminase
MLHEAISGPEMPRSLGPYSHVIRAGDFLFIAGQPGLNSDTGDVPPTFEAQARLAFENLARVLRASGSGMEQVVKTTVFLTDATAFAAMNQLYQEFFPHRPPLRSTPIVQLPRGLLISIEAIAIAPAK